MAETADVSIAFVGLVGASALSTGAMLRLGRVEQGRMVGLSAASQKLRRRAVRIVAEISGASSPRSRAALVRTGWSVRAALADLRQARRQGRRR